jgi:RNA polymerase sigma-70 factor, ECF subfamily
MTASALATVFLGRWRDTIADMPDTKLVERAKAGDTAAFSELVRRHQHVVYNLAYRYMRDASAAEDMSQEAFLKAFRMLKGFRGDCAFSTWMYRVTSSVCLSELSRRKRRAEVALDSDNNTETAVHPGQSHDIPEIVRRCVGELPDRYAQIITMYYLKEISYEEIAQVMDVPLGTLKTWMHRARKQLRVIVEREVSQHEQDVLP